MTRTWWIIIFVAAGVGLAILLGLLAGCNEDKSQERAVSSLCSSLDSLQSDTRDLISLSPTTASEDDYQSAVEEVQSSWDDVQSDLGEVESTTRDELSNAWDDYQSALQDIPSDATVQESLQGINEAGQTLESATESTISAVNCS
jgi:hypothetical protein